MLNNGYRYVKTLIDIDQLLKDTKNKYRLISQRGFKGKRNENGEIVIPEGTTLGLQILEDHSEPGSIKTQEIQNLTMYLKLLK